MKDLLFFLENNFEFFFAFCLLWVVGASLFFVWRRKASDPLHPPIDRSSTTFIEKYASGFSRKSLFTRYGGASNALVVTVFKDALLIEPIALLKWIMPKGFNGLAHYIPKANILSTRPSSSFGRSSLQIEFRTKEGEKRTVELIVRKPQAFLEALKT